MNGKEKMRGLNEAGWCVGKGNLVCSMVLLIALLWLIASFKGVSLVVFFSPKKL